MRGRPGRPAPAWGEGCGESLAIGGEDRHFSREGAGEGLAELVLEREGDVDLGLGGQEVGGERLVPGVDRREMGQRLAPGPRDLDAAAADQGVGAAQRGDVQTGQTLVGVRRGFRGAVVPCPLAGPGALRRP